MDSIPTDDALGINGLGRIGKLTLWHHVARRHFPRVVVNVGRRVGVSLNALCGVIENDSTYGSMHRFLFGVDAKPCVKIVDQERHLLEVAGVPVTILERARNPRDIGWRSQGVRVVVDTTGAFCDPTRAMDHADGSLRGHLRAGAEVVLNSAPFKIKKRGLSTPEDGATLIYGINHQAFDPARHRLIAAASCTTTALAHMIKPLLERLDASKIMTASMSTIHAATNSQSVLDAVPKAGATDLRRSRSALNSIILTSTNAARALEEVIPQIREVGFMADSVRIPIPTESLIILNLTFQSRLTQGGNSTITHEVLNEVFADAARGPQRGLLVYSRQQNVPADVRGMRAAVVIEAAENHTRTGFVRIDLSEVPGVEPKDLPQGGAPIVEVPVTHAKLFGWYDNEYGSYTNLLGDLTVHVHQSIS